MKQKRTRRKFPDNLVGKTQKAAEAAVVKKGLTPMSLGPNDACTADFRTDRVKLDVVDGKVTGARIS